MAKRVGCWHVPGCWQWLDGLALIAIQVQLREDHTSIIFVVILFVFAVLGIELRASMLDKCSAPELHLQPLAGDVLTSNIINKQGISCIMSR